MSYSGYALRPEFHVVSNIDRVTQSSSDRGRADKLYSGLIYFEGMGALPGEIALSITLAATLASKTPTLV